MTSISVTALCKDLHTIMTSANEGGAPIFITNNRGKGAVLVGEDDWAAIEETLYLMGIPGVAGSIFEGMAESAHDCACVGEDADTTPGQGR